MSTDLTTRAHPTAGQALTSPQTARATAAGGMQERARRHRVVGALERRVVPAPLRRVGPTVRRVVAAAGDAGMATAEYAIVTLAAVGFAGLLVAILRGGEVKGLLLGLIRQALAQ
ncbi:DUF4244 domain-containing protein [Cellulomonas biazotea]|uniref:DUF4244 domain-containing protein n=1 Tax=Cellulomonas biazotea TaxID=1709 RepID=A0A402DMV3_9CELL|nr:DUF4244 domain-containing protein [Cellulomonas biazotea]GCE75446.1 hypothetical protein CBZ_05020 [Cellulomonas biazotea]